MARFASSKVKQDCWTEGQLSLVICQQSFVSGEQMGDTAKANELEDRLIDFAVRIISVADALPEKLMKQERLEALIDENQQLCKILNASVKTAKLR